MSAWEQFIQKLGEEKKSLDFKDDQRCFYRGHSSMAWTLTPTLFRACVDETQTDRLERLLFSEFSSRARQLHSGGLTGWDILFHMRHHGVPTRLLDWTEVLGVALFFALRDFADAKDDLPCIWLLNPYKLNQKSWWKWEGLLQPKYLGTESEDSDIFYDYADFLENEWAWGWDSPVAITPAQKNDRMHAQRGWFTIHGDNIGSLEKQCPHVVRKVEMPVKAIPNAKQFFEWAGIDDYSLFPDLDGLRSSLVKKYCATES